MHYVTKGVIILFKLALFALLLYMVYIEMYQYLENNDVSSLHYKKFMGHNEDVYPTFSVCIVASHGRIDVNAVFQGYQRKTKGQDGKSNTERFFDFDSVFRVSYQDPNRICLTKKELQEEGRLIKYDLLKLTSNWLPVDNRMCLIYIHPKGQLIRSLTKPTFTLIGKALRNGKLKGPKGFNYIIIMRNNAMEVLRKRPDAIEVCNDTLKDDDIQWRQTVIQKIQCIPTFMKRFLSQSIVHNQMPECSPAQYKEMDEIYDPWDSFHAAAKFYTPPCTQMNSIVTINEDVMRFDDHNDTSLWLKLEYPLDYKETVNKRAFTGYDLLSQIGGIVGIIVGYSLMQIPGVFEYIFVQIQRRIPPPYKQELIETTNNLNV